jgi:multiple sugar transport system permease protein
MITVAIFSFIFYWNDFQGPLIYLRSDNKFTLALGILSLRGDYASKWNYIMAASLVMVVPAVVLFAIVLTITCINLLISRKHVHY